MSFICAIFAMGTLRILAVIGAALMLGACATEEGPPGSTTTTTTRAPLPTIVVNGTASKTLGCFSGVGGNDSFSIALGENGWWDFYFQGCTTLATETVALWDPAGGPSADAFQAPTGYACRMSIDGTSDQTKWFTHSIGSVTDTGGLIFLENSSAWHHTTNWTITCIDDNQG